MSDASKNKTHTVVNIAYGGEGIVKAENQPVTFVPFTRLGDQIEFDIVEQKKNFNRGKLSKLIQAGPGQAQAKCQYFGQCGACNYQHIDEKHEYRLKYEHVRDSLLKLSSNNLETRQKNAQLIQSQIDALPDNEEQNEELEKHAYHYRNKVVLRVRSSDENKGHLGFLDIDSNFLPIKNCAVVHPNIDSKIKTINTVLKQQHFKHLMYITIRNTSSGMAYIFSFDHQANIHGCAAFLKRNFTFNNKASIYFSFISPKKHFSPIGKTLHHMAGPEYVFETVNDIRYQLYPSVFWQINPNAAEHISNDLIDLCKKHDIESCIDVYCGAGLFSIQLAKHNIRCIGIEINEDAILNAKSTAQNQDLEEKAFFIHDSAEKALATIQKNQESFDAIIVDPPRKGLSQKTIDAMAGIENKYIIYISCDPNTFARDCKSLEAKGYQLKDINVYNMFPQTYHIECMGIFEK